MELILVRHGEARSAVEDPERSLTDRGVEVVQKIAAWACAAGISVNQIRHSGKRRAQQTAEILGRELKPVGGVTAVSGIKPGDDVHVVAEPLAYEQDDVMLVGHLPFLGRLASLLVTGRSEPGVVLFRNAGVVCLSRQQDRWYISWVLPPDMTGP